MNITHMGIIYAILVFGSARQSDQTVLENSQSPMPGQQLFARMLGTWEGNCKTWFRPDQLGDESRVTGKITEVFGGLFIRHTYEGTIQGKTRRGENLLAYNSITNTYQSSWIDDFHMSYAIMFSEGKATRGGFVVEGKYDVGKNQAQWGWKTEFELFDNDNLTITSYNILPDGKTFKAVETIYHRVAKP